MLLVLPSFSFLLFASYIQLSAQLCVRITSFLLHGVLKSDMELLDAWLKIPNKQSIKD